MNNPIISFLNVYLSINYASDRRLNLTNKLRDEYTVIAYSFLLR